MELSGRGTSVSPTSPRLLARFAIVAGLLGIFLFGCATHHSSLHTAHFHTTDLAALTISGVDIEIRDAFGTPLPTRRARDTFRALAVRADIEFDPDAPFRVEIHIDQISFFRGYRSIQDVAATLTVVNNADDTVFIQVLLTRETDSTIESPTLSQDLLQRLVPALVSEYRRSYRPTPE